MTRCALFVFNVLLDGNQPLAMNWPACLRRHLCYRSCSFATEAIIIYLKMFTSHILSILQSPCITRTVLFWKPSFFSIFYNTETANCDPLFLAIDVISCKAYISVHSLFVKKDLINPKSFWALRAWIENCHVSVHIFSIFSSEMSNFSGNVYVRSLSSF